jgi:hypothetical protein
MYMKRSILSLITSLFCKSTDNSFSLDKYAYGGVFLVGDIVRMYSIIPYKRTGVVIDINKHRYTDNFKTYSVEVDIKGKKHRICPRRLQVLERRNSYAEHWKCVYGDDNNSKKYLDEDCHKLNERMKKPFIPDMETLYHPEDLFIQGLGVLSAGSDKGLARSYFELLLKSSAYILDNEEHCLSSYQWTLSAQRVLSIRAYTQALCGQEMEIDLLLRSIDYAKKRCESLSPSDWWAHEQDSFLSAVRMAIIANDMDLARELLKCKRNFKQHKDQRMLLKKLVRKSIFPLDDRELEKNCRMYLEFIRNPSSCNSSVHSSVWAKLEWGAVLEKFYSPDNKTIDWDNVIKMVYK